ncbi:diguanylate cyclase domain-containing protein [Desulfovibrio sp. JC010]|uniref:sensor domain-containing diguanylate cyclase n=1 Tax=Desulfovibrio sp. JC010 TaxID=2593641 RepID=UPI0013CFBA51|nr:diguanylate cyclase [Desulfovibrio sp. JC010]NDV28639.1 diguanylate cyclase [Desulfovibrio sp. JC010]
MIFSARTTNLFSKWIPFRLIIPLVVILTIAGYLCLKLDSMSIRDQERIFNEQQALQAKLVATALKDKLDSIVNSSSTLAEYSLVDFISGKRSAESIKKLFKIKQNAMTALTLISFHTSPENEPITSDINSPRLVQAHQVAQEWTEKYYSAISGMRSGFITPKPLVNEKMRLAGLLVPVWNENNFAGLLTVVIDLDRLTDKYIVPLQVGRFGSGYIVDGSGTVIFDQESEILGKNIFELHKGYQDLIRIDSRMLHEQYGTGEYSFTVKRNQRVERKLVAWNTARLGEMRLVVAISAPETDATNSMTSIQTVRAAMLIFILLLFFAIVFFFYYHRSQQILLRQNKELQSKDNLFEAIAGNAPGIIYKCEMNQPYAMHYISTKVRKVTGYDPEDFLRGGKSMYYDLVHPEDRAGLKNEINEALGNNKSFEYEYRILRSDGSERKVYEKGIKLPEEGSMVGFILDITDHKKKEEALRQAEENYSALVTTAPLGIFQTTPQGEFINANSQMAHYYGYSSPETFLNEASNIAKDCYVVSGERDRLLTILKKFGHTENFEARHKRKDGSTFWASESIMAIKDEDGNIIRMDGFLMDISERKEHEETMRRLAMFDNLTGLPNRVLFDDRLKQALSHANRNRMKVAILYADLDNFKQVNDELGHMSGDSVLKEVAGRFSDCLRTSDTLSRIGGDEFIFILQDVGTRNEIEVVAQRIIDSMRAPFYVGEKVYRIGVSIGISIFPDNGEEKEKLIRLADEAMYKAKSRGKNGYSF